MPAAPLSHDYTTSSNIRALVEEDPVVKRLNSRVPVACGRCRGQKKKCSGDPGDGTACRSCVAADECEFYPVGAQPLQMYSLPNTLDARSDAIRPVRTLETTAPVGLYSGDNDPAYDQTSLLRPSAQSLSAALPEMWIPQEVREQRTRNNAFVNDNRALARPSTGPFTNPSTVSTQNVPTPMALSADSALMNPTIPRPPPRSRAPMQPHPRYSPPVDFDESNNATVADSAIDPRLL